VTVGTSWSEQPQDWRAYKQFHKSICKYITAI